MEVLQTVLRNVLARYRNEEGQDLLVVLLILFVLWLLITGGRIVIQ